MEIVNVFLWQKADGKYVESTCKVYGRNSLWMRCVFSSVCAIFAVFLWWGSLQKIRTNVSESESVTWCFAWHVDSRQVLKEIFTKKTPIIYPNSNAGDLDPWSVCKETAASFFGIRRTVPNLVVSEWWAIFSMKLTATAPYFYSLPCLQASIFMELTVSFREVFISYESMKECNNWRPGILETNLKKKRCILHHRFAEQESSEQTSKKNYTTDLAKLIKSNNPHLTTITRHVMVGITRRKVIDLFFWYLYFELLEISIKLQFIWAWNTTNFSKNEKNILCKSYHFWWIFHPTFKKNHPTKIASPKNHRI